MTNTYLIRQGYNYMVWRLSKDQIIWFVIYIVCVAHQYYATLVVVVVALVVLFLVIVGVLEAAF